MRLFRLPVRRRPRLRARFLLAVAGRLRGLRGQLEAQPAASEAQWVANGEVRFGRGEVELCLTLRGRGAADSGTRMPTGAQYSRRGGFLSRSAVRQGRSG